MHLWPSDKVRNSFKRDYLHNIERINTLNSLKKNQKKPSQSTNTKLLHSSVGPLSFCKELVLIFTCCFCFGDEEMVEATFVALGFRAMVIRTLYKQQLDHTHLRRVYECCRRFIELMVPLDGIPNGLSKGQFVNGLKEEIRSK
ncbi:hypothetical protein RDABS01_039117 [Bienertia sinuspersici]